MSLPGLEVLRREMARQYTDALQSFHEAHEQAPAIASRIRETGRLTLLGMGASHWANRMVLASYRAAGIEAAAEVLSEAMRMPQPPRDRVTILVSQSGGSGEVAAYLDRTPDHADHFGLTLNTDSTLGRAVPCLIGVGGREQAFAATRSITLTLCLHAAILAALGEDMNALIDVLNSGDPLGAEPPADALDTLQDTSLLVMSARGQLHGALQAASLTFMELARTPAMALELGQLLHGPMEMLEPTHTLVLARPVGADAAAVTRTAQAAVSYGLRPVLFDLGDQPTIDGAIHVQLPPLNGLAGVAVLLPAVQRLAIEAAAARVGDGFGTPLRSSKVTNGEAP
ncbi:SIS domain-containing protein [Tianweitania sediminis]|uniref:Glutamine--fructose-6-phosphate aminotransferase [isomerizing] n=1 Tax=Tianweitania sediminis TaxID=1502156 RepID=A0A8J7UGZ9_9HYPH|nr:aminotransferase [Tianweitania sediminis]